MARRRREIHTTVIGNPGANAHPSDEWTGSGC